MKLRDMTAADYAFSQPPADACESWIQSQLLLSGNKVECFDKLDRLVCKAKFVRGCGHLIQVDDGGLRWFPFDRVFTTVKRLRHTRKVETFVEDQKQMCFL